MTGLLSHLSDEFGNDRHISVRRKANGHMTVNIYGYNIAALGWKKTGLLKDDFFKGNFLTLRVATACKHYIAGQANLP